MIQNLSPEEIVRREALQKLRSKGIEPFPAAEFKVTTTANDIVTNYEENREVTIAGRLLNVRDMGKSIFAHLQDASGKVQLYLNIDVLCPGEDKSFYKEVVKHLLHF